MRLFLDHCVSRRTVDYLRQIGHEVLTSKELEKESAFDRDILAAAASTDRVLVTEDRGFGDIRKYPPRDHSGVILLRPRKPASRLELHRTLGAFFQSTDRETLRACLVLVDETRIRLRR